MKQVPKDWPGFSDGSWQCDWGWDCGLDVGFSNFIYFYAAAPIDPPVLGIWDLIGQAYVDGSVQTAFAGQPIGLEPYSSSGGPVSQCLWSVPSHVVGDQEVTAAQGFLPAAPPEVNTTDLSAFWNAAFSPSFVSVTCLDDWTNYFVSAEVDYSVVLPVLSATATYGPISVDTNYAPCCAEPGWYMHWGSILSGANSSFGALWRFGVDPSTPSGSLQMAQTISVNLGPEQADHVYPYFTDIPPATSASVSTSQSLVQLDAPAQELQSATFIPVIGTQANIRQDFIDYFIYWPDGGIPVVVATSVWGWGATTTKQSDGTWSNPPTYGGPLGETPYMYQPFDVGPLFPPPAWNGIATFARFMRKM